MVDSYQEYVRKQILEEKQKERIYEIRQLDIKLAVLYEEMFRVKILINALEGKREALKDEYKNSHPYLWKGWDVT
jgi:hypothetical protein